MLQRKYSKLARQVHIGLESWPLAYVLELVADFSAFEWHQALRFEVW